MAKIDDDSSINLDRLRFFLELARCETHLLLGAVHYSGFVPRADWSGVRGDRCGWGWGLHMALQDFGREGADGRRGAPGYRPFCDEMGALLPFPYPAGQGYVMSQAVLQWVGTSDAVRCKAEIRSVAIRCDPLRSVAIRCDPLRSVVVQCGPVRSRTIPCDPQAFPPCFLVLASRRAEVLLFRGIPYPRGTLRLG